MSTGPGLGESELKEIQLLIDGRWREGRSAERFVRRCPLDGSEATWAAAATAEDAVAAVEAAGRAQAAWSGAGPSQRRAVLERAAQGIGTRKNALIEAMMEETGAGRLWSEFNVLQAQVMVREAAAATTRVSGEVIPSDVPGSLAMAVRQPAGVVLGIAPWNAPVILGVRAIAMPLACGNTVVLKGSEICPRVHALIAEAFHEALVEAGMPGAAINYIVHAPAAAGEVVEAMVAHAAVRRVNFTGSTRVGRLIAASCARHLKPVLLELGGKAPLVVLADADLDAAAQAAAFGAYLHSGQICMSTERLIVDASVADEFAARLAGRISGLVPRDPRQADSVLGAVVDAETVHRCNRMIDDALAKGAVLVHGGKADSPLMAPVLLDRVTAEMAIYREESFGPVKGIVRVDGPEQAVRCANDTEYGLSSAIFSRDLAAALALARRIDSGICHINGPTVHDEPQMPFGGVKASGFGRFGGTAGIDAFTDLRWITVQTGPRSYPF